MEHPPTETLQRLDRGSTSTIWLQIMMALEAEISKGTWQPGEKIPSESALQEHYQVSRTSIRRALARLEDQGIIERQQGRGSFVSPQNQFSVWTLPEAPQLIGTTPLGHRRPLISTIIRAHLDTLPAWAAAALAQPQDSTGFVLERTRSLGALTAAHVVNYLPKRFIGLIPSLRDPRVSLYGEMERVAGVRITRAHRTIEAISADRRMAALLEVEEGHALVVVQAVAYDDTGTAVDVSEATVRTDRLSIEVGTGPLSASQSPSGTYRTRGVTRQNQ